MDPKNINFTAMPQTVVNVITRPADFFQKMPKTGGLLEPLVFVVIMGFITGMLRVLMNFAGLGLAGAGVMSGPGVIFFMPIAVAILSFISAAILFLIWKLMGSKENYETAYRCGAYLAALAPITAIIGLVPYAGGIVNMGIYVFFLVTASIHVHNLPKQKAWIVFGVIGVIFALWFLKMEHDARNMSPEMEKWRRMGDDMRKEYRDSTKDMEKSSEEMRKQAEEMARKFGEQAEEAKKQAEQNQ